MGIDDDDDNAIKPSSLANFSSGLESLATFSPGSPFCVSKESGAAGWIANLPFSSPDVASLVGFSDAEDSIYCTCQGHYTIIKT